MSDSLANISAVLFDVDGTLVDSYRLYMESYRRALSPFLGYSPTDEELATRLHRAERKSLQTWLGPELGAVCHLELCSHYRELHPSLSEGMYDGVREMLRGLRSAGIALGIVTGKGSSAWEVTASAIDLGRFDVVVTEDDVEHPKPHPGGLLAAAGALRILPEQAVYIGDSAVDIVAARNARMRFGAALWPKTAGERKAFMTQIATHGADWAFDRPAEVVRTFAQWC